jgi:hypothetical protein
MMKRMRKLRRVYHQELTVLRSKVNMVLLLNKVCMVNSTVGRASNKAAMASLLQVRADTGSKVAMVSSREVMVSLKEGMEGPPQGSQHRAAIHRSRAEATRLLRRHGTDDYSSRTAPAATAPSTLFTGMSNALCRTRRGAV